MFFRILFFILFFISHLFSKEVVVYVNSHLSDEKMLEQWQPTIDLLNKEIPEHHFRILLIPPSKVNEIKKMLGENKIDLLITQPAITSELIYSNNIVPMLTLANKYHMSEFGSVFISRKDNNHINTIHDIKGKTIAAGAPFAFGGWLMGYGELVDNGIDPLKDKKVSFLDDQKKIVKSIIDGQYDIGIVRTGMIEELSENGSIDSSKLKFINLQKGDYPLKVSTKLYPEWSISRAENLDMHLSNQIFKVLSEIQPTDIEAIQGQYYHWHLPVSHKEVDLLFKKLNLGYYKDLPKYNIEDMIKIAIYTALVMILFAILVVVYLKYEYTSRLKDKIYKELQLKEKKVEELHKRLFLAADQALAGYWEWNLDTNYLFFSKGWKSFLGYNEDELENNFETFTNLLHPDDINSTMNIVNQYIKEQNNGTYNTKFRLRHKDGSYKWVSAIGTISQDKANIFFGFHIDITDLTTTKETLFEQSKSAMMGEMIGAIAHQFKQPLNVISVTASKQLLSMEFGAKVSNEVIVNDANEYLNQVKYLSETIDTFRNFLKPNNEKITTTIENILENSLQIVSKSLKNNDIEIVKSFSQTQEIEVYTSELAQVFINIINNSKDAFNINNIDNRVIKIQTLQEENRLIVEIEDTAGGIPTDKIDNIFNAYFTTKEKEGGTGLGLYIVKTIIEEHYNGSIRVQNTKSGAKFTIVLPIVNH
jgi:PAS domain S-box-containing protein